MKIYIEKRRIVCSTDEIKRDYWYRAEYKLFVGGVNYNPRYATIEPVGYEYKTSEEANADLSKLSEILRLAAEYGIEADEPVYKYRDELQAVYGGLYAAEQAERDNRKRQAEWETRRRFGCGHCKSLCYRIDAPVCKETGELLTEKNEPCYADGTYYLFHFVPYPSEMCPYNLQKSEVPV